MTTADLFEDVKNKVGCMYISDPRRGHDRIEAIRTMRTQELTAYPLPALEDMAEYLFGEKVHFAGYEEHPVWYFLTPGQDYKVVLIGGYTTPSDDKDTYGIPISLEERDALIEKAQQNSTFQADEEIGDEERLMTLSTCAYEFDGARYVLVGALRELAPSLEGGAAA